MYHILRTDEFDSWLAKLKDLRAKAKILARIRSAEFGNLGDTKNTQRKDIERAKSLMKKYEDIVDEWS